MITDLGPYTFGFGGRLGGWQEDKALQRKEASDDRKRATTQDHSYINNQNSSACQGGLVSYSSAIRS